MLLMISFDRFFFKFVVMWVLEDFEQSVVFKIKSFKQTLTTKLLQILELFVSFCLYHGKEFSVCYFVWSLNSVQVQAADLILKINVYI